MADQYAKIQSGIVINIILAQSTDYFDPAFTWVDISALSPLPQIGWTYSDGAFTPPAPILPTLAVAIAENLTNFSTAMNNFITSRYSDSVRINFIGIYLNAQINSLTNRMAYIAPLLVWQNQVIVYSANYVNTVSALTDVPTILSTTWDFTTLTSEDPLLTPIGALAISN